MTNELDETLALIRDQASRLLTSSAQPDYLKSLLDKPASFDRTHWGAAVEQVWPAIAVPESAGGIGLGWRGLCALMEEIGKKTVSLPLIANAVTSASLLANTDQALIERYVGPLASGELIACLAFSEPGESGLPTRSAVRWQDGALSGSKSVTAFAAVADVALVQASVDGELVLLVVELDQPGVLRHIEPTFDNARANASLVFSKAQASRLSLADAYQVFQQALALSALATAFEQIGGSAACLTMARDYALERTAFGQPIGRFQAIKHKVADMYSRLEIARGCASDALEALELNEPMANALAASARLGGTEAFEFAARENIQIHGGLGVTWEAMPHHYYRRARSLALELGSPPFWRDHLLSQLGFDATSNKATP